MTKTFKLPRKPSHSPEEWSKIITAWKATKLSAEEFAAKNNITVKTLQRWCSVLKHSNSRTKTKANKQAINQSTPEFIPVKVVGQTSPEIYPDNQAKVELEFKSGHVVRLQGNITPSTIAQIYRAIIKEIQC